MQLNQINWKKRPTIRRFNKIFGLLQDRKKTKRWYLPFNDYSKWTNRIIKSKAERDIANECLKRWNNWTVKWQSSTFKSIFWHFSAKLNVPKEWTRATLANIQNEAEACPLIFLAFGNRIFQLNQATINSI